MTEPVLLDTGPLVAILDAASEWHDASRRVFNILRKPPITCWPVVTEAAFLLRKTTTGYTPLLELVRVGAVRVVDLPSASVDWIARFANKYRELKPDLADAALMYLAEKHDVRTVFAIDRRDFTVYRVKGRAVRIIPESKT